MNRIPYSHRPVPLTLATLVVLLVTLVVPKHLAAQPAQSSTADTTISSEISSSDSEPQRVQAEPAPDKSGIDSATDVEIQRRFNEFHHGLLDARREFLDKRAKDVDWWLIAIVVFLTLIAVFLTFFAVVVAIVGYFGFQRFRDIEAKAEEHAGEAERFVDQIKAKRDEAESLLKDINAETVHNDPDKASEVMETVQQNPAASLTDRAVADATLLQQQGKREEAIEKWRSIANIAGAADPQLQARAWFSVGYLHGEEDNWEAAIDAYDKAIELSSDSANSYNNRGNAKRNLGRHEDALVDLDEAIRLNSNHAEAYNNRGVTKKTLGRLDEAREDYQKALTLAQKSGNDALIAIVKRNLSRLDNDKAP